MPKIPHRTFEIYETFEDAALALKRKVAKTESELSALDSSTFEHLAVSGSAGVMRVRFREASTFTEATVAGLRTDFAQLADKLDKDSTVVVDFTGVELFDAAFVDALLLFRRQLRTRGSRIALCCLAPTALAYFFTANDRS
jgi:MFS superfamily sulfate permease-like transporter